MLYLNAGQRKELIEYSKKALPYEACGILAGRGNMVEKVYPMTNADKSAQSFFMDSKEQIKVMKDMRNSGLDFVGIYHSHPETEARPSAHDIELAYYPDVSYVIVSLKDKDNPVTRSFKIKQGEISEEGLKTE